MRIETWNLFTVAALMAGSAGAWQAPVATIKPSDPARPKKFITVRGQDLLVGNYTLKDLVTVGYELHAKQVTGGPGWIESDKYDITARPEAPGQPNMAQIRLMIQSLVADRFQLKFHREKKEQSVYAITVAKGGPKLAKNTDDPAGLPSFSASGSDNGGLTFRIKNATIGEFVTILQGGIVLDKPLVDQTGLSGKYDSVLNFTPDPSQVAGPRPQERKADSPDAPPDLFTAFQQQLGLRLQSVKAPVDVLVIDRVEKPSAN